MTGLVKDFLLLSHVMGIMPYANNKDTDQPAHLHSLISAFVVRCLDSRATENRIFAGPDRFLVCKTDSVCIKRIFFRSEKNTLRIIYWPNYLD